MKIVCKSLLLCACLGWVLPAYALKSDTQQPIHIDSGSQSLDMTNNIVTLADGVTITQGSIKVQANKVIIRRHENKREILEASGSPVTFQQTLDNGKPVNGSANHVQYDLNSEFLVLSGNAQLKQQDSSIKADKITYDVQKQQLKASGKNRVKTVLLPAQLNDGKASLKKK